MSKYPETAAKINERLKEALDGVEISDDQLKKVIDSFLWFGQTAKFRCRNNSAYDNFARLTLRDIAKVERGPIPDGRGGEFEALQVVQITREQ